MGIPVLPGSAVLPFYHNKPGWYPGSWGRHGKTYGPLAAYNELFLEDADFLWTTGVLSKDRNEIQQQVVNSFKLIPSGYKHISTLERIRFLKPDIVIGDGTTKFVREGASENEKPFWIARSTCVYKKEKGQWRCSAVRLIPIQSE